MFEICTRLHQSKNPIFYHYLFTSHFKNYQNIKTKPNQTMKFHSSAVLVLLASALTGSAFVPSSLVARKSAVATTAAFGVPKSHQQRKELANRWMSTTEAAAAETYEFTVSQRIRIVWFCISFLYSILV